MTCGAESSVLRVCGIAELVGEARGRPVDRALVGLRVGIEQQLARDRSGGRWPGRRGRARGSRSAGRARCAGGTRARRARPSRVIGMRVSVLSSSNRHSSTLVGDLREQREIGAGAVVRRAERIGASGPDLHAAPSIRMCGGRSRVQRTAEAYEQCPRRRRSKRAATPRRRRAWRRRSAPRAGGARAAAGPRRPAAARHALRRR